MRGEKLEHLVKIGMIEGKCRGKQHEKMLDGLTKQLKVGRVTEVLKARRDRDTWKVMIAYAKEHGTWLIDYFLSEALFCVFHTKTNMISMFFIVIIQ